MSAAASSTPAGTLVGTLQAPYRHPTPRERPAKQPWFRFSGPETVPLPINPPGRSGQPLLVCARSSG